MQKSDFLNFMYCKIHAVLLHVNVKGYFSVGYKSFSAF